MAKTLLEVYNLRMSNSEPFLARIEAALVKYACYCRDTSQHADWWPTVLDDPAGKATRMAWEVCFDANIVNADTVTDAALQGAVEAVALKY